MPVLTSTGASPTEMRTANTSSAPSRLRYSPTRRVSALLSTPAPIDHDDRVDAAFTDGSLEPGVAPEQRVPLESSPPASIGIVHHRDGPKPRLPHAAQSPKGQLGVFDSADESRRRPFGRPFFLHVVQEAKRNPSDNGQGRAQQEVHDQHAP